MVISNKALVWRCYQKLVADHACYQGNWICDETLVRLLTKQLPSLNDGIGLNLTVFNRGGIGGGAHGLTSKTDQILQENWASQKVCVFFSRRNRRDFLVWSTWVREFG